MHTKTHKELIIFDLDGTLINTISDLAAACNYALQQCGYRPHPVADYPKMVGNGIYKLMMRALRAQGVEADEQGPEVMAMTPHFKAYYNVHYADSSTPYPGMPELLRELSNRQFLLAVASNKYQAATEVIVRKFFPEIPFVGILGQRDGVAKKPDPTIVHELMQLSCVTDKDAVLYIGDSGVDMDTAHNAGVEAVGVTWGFAPREELLLKHADHLADSAEQILPFAS